jgi:hypothetical protein
MPLQFSTAIRCEWEAGAPDGIAISRQQIDLLPPSFTTLWIEDHLQRGSNPLLESWTTLAYLAAQYPRFQYGHLVDCQSYRNPALVAKMAATLQYLTGGHYILGVGAGWREEEYRAYGYEFPAPAVRVAQLEEALQVLRTMWSRSPATFRGTHFHIEEAYCEPRPSPMIPILVGTSGAKAMQVAARLADAWTWSGPFDTVFQPLCERLRRSCEAVGRDPAEITIWSEHVADFPDDPATFVPGGPDDEQKLGPTPGDAIRQLRPYIEYGITHFIVRMDTRALERFCAEVVPAIV